MKLRTALPLAAVAALSLSGCPSKTVQEGAKAVPKATQAQCQVERDIMQKAVEAYTLLKGQPPKDEASMVPDWLIDQSAYYDLDAKGNVVPHPGTGCT
jgi:hypothetical protein